MDLLEREMENSPFDLVVTDCTEDSYYVSIINGFGCVCNGNCKTDSDINSDKYQTAFDQMNEIVRYIVRTPALHDMYENFLETDEEKERFRRGEFHPHHVAENAHLVFDRTITSLVETIKETANRKKPYAKAKPSHTNDSNDDNTIATVYR